MQLMTQCQGQHLQNTGTPNRTGIGTHDVGWLLVEIENLSSTARIHWHGGVNPASKRAFSLFS